MQDPSAPPPAVCDWCGLFQEKDVVENHFVSLKKASLCMVVATTLIDNRFIFFFTLDFGDRGTPNYVSQLSYANETKEEFKNLIAFITNPIHGIEVISLHVRVSVEHPLKEPCEQSMCNLLQEIINLVPREKITIFSVQEIGFPIFFGVINGFVGMWLCSLEPFPALESLVFEDLMTRQRQRLVIEDKYFPKLKLVYLRGGMNRIMKIQTANIFENYFSKIPPEAKFALTPPQVAELFPDSDLGIPHCDSMRLRMHSYEHMRNCYHCGGKEWMEAISQGSVAHRLAQVNKVLRDVYQKTLK